MSRRIVWIAFFRDGKVTTKVSVRQRKASVAKRKKPPAEPADGGSSPGHGTEDTEDQNDIFAWDEGQWFSDTDTSCTSADGPDQI